MVTADALAWLQSPPDQRYDLVFLDPPFEAGLWEEAARRLGPWLSPEAWIYVETPAKTAIQLPADWRLHREGTTREVRYALFRTGNGAAPESAATIAGEPNPQGNPSA